MRYPEILSSVVGRAAAIVVALAMAGCGGGGGSSPTTSSATAALSLTAFPTPVVGDLCGSHCGNLDGEREALVRLTIRETGGVGANVTGGSQELRDSATGAVIAASTLEAADFIRDDGTTRVPAQGELVYHAGVHYPASHAGAAATFTFTIRASDDNGHSVTATLAVPTTG